MPELTTVETVRNWVGADSTEDSTISLILEGVERKIRTVCDRTSFITGSYTDKFSGESWDSVELRHKPVATASTVTVVVKLDADSSVTVDEDSYRIDSETGILRLIQLTPLAWLNSSVWLAGYGPYGAGFPPDFKNVEVTYTGGYASASIPSDLQLIAVEWAAALYRGKDSDPSVRQEQLGNHSITYAVGATDTDPTTKRFRQELYDAGYARPPV